VEGVPPLTQAAIARLLRHGRAMLDEPRVRAFVLGLEGCLTQIPPRLRTVLRLRVGVAEPRPLSAGAVAARLHVSQKRLAKLEVRALRLLSHAARTSGCARRAAVVPGLALVSFPGTSAAGGGVAGGLYFKEPAASDAQPIPPAEAIPAPTLRVPQGSDGPLVWALIAALGGALLVAYLVRSDMGLGPLSLGRRRRRRSGGS
jgi:hypothetical protein